MRMRERFASRVPVERTPLLRPPGRPPSPCAERKFSPWRNSRYAWAVPRITIEPIGVTLDCNDGESVFTCARRNDVFIPTACAGKATCGLCRVKVLAGEANVTPINREEQKHLGNTYFITKLRLSCQLRPTGDITVRVPDMPEPKKLPKL
jgi:ferredoxin, 2Fe-2S